MAESTSIVTVYLSGKVPGVYSTSLKKVTLTSESPEATREKRNAEGIIRATKTLRLYQDATESNNYWDLVIESSFEEAEQPECREHTVTVTVVETVGCNKIAIANNALKIYLLPFGEAIISPVRKPETGAIWGILAGSVQGTFSYK